MTAISSGGKFKEVGSKPFTFTQATPLAVWVIDHNLGHRPDVDVYSQSGQLVRCDVDHPTVNRTVLSFSIPFVGSANLI